MLSSLWVPRTGSTPDWCVLQEVLYKCTDKIQYKSLKEHKNTSKINGKLTLKSRAPQILMATSLASHFFLLVSDLSLVPLCWNFLYLCVWWEATRFCVIMWHIGRRVAVFCCASLCCRRRSRGTCGRMTRAVEVVATDQKEESSFPTIRGWHRRIAGHHQMLPVSN